MKKGKMGVVLQNQKGLSKTNILSVIPIASVIILALIAMGLGVDSEIKQANATKNRKALAYEGAQYCESVSDGLTVRVINPKNRGDINDSIGEQWISFDKLAIEASKADDARLITLKDGHYQLELPEGATCQ